MLPSTRLVPRQFDKKLPSDNEFANLKIRYRCCCRYAPNTDDGELCVCNESRDHPKHKGKQTEQWTIQENTKIQKHKNYGQLLNGALFMRIDIETDVEKVEDLLLKVWNIPKPKLIMSIIGGAKYFQLNDRLESNFINGIVNVATKSDVWMITNGYNTGIVQFVGEAINKIRIKKDNKDIVAIGICKWGSIKNVNDVTGLPKDEPSVEKKTKKKGLILNDDDEEEEAKKHQSGECDLEMNHSHYLMLDDGRYRYFDSKTFRTRLCSQLANLNNKQSLHTPLVTIVVEGGFDTIANIYYDLQQDIPIVIIDGSGRVADFFNRCLLRTKDHLENSSEHRKIRYEIDEYDDITPITDQSRSKRTDNRRDIHVQLHANRKMTRLRSIFNKYLANMKTDLKNTLYRDEDLKKSKNPKTKNDYDEKIDKSLDFVLYCIQPSVRSYITVFNLNSENNLSDTIFGSICRSYDHILKPQKTKSNEKSNIVGSGSLLELAMDWDCIDVAKDFVLENSLTNIPDPDQSFKDALQRNLPTFVDEFLKLGIDPGDTFFPNNSFFDGKARYDDFINTLYTDSKAIQEGYKPPFIPFIKENEKIVEKGINSPEALNIILRTLIGDYMHKLYFNSFQEEEDYKILWGLLTEREYETIGKFDHIENRKPLTDEGKKQQITHEYVMRDLFIWSVLMNYTDMSKVFLFHMKYRICPALIATQIYKKYHNKATYGELRDEYKDKFIYFEQYAINCLNKCNDNDADIACQIVLQQNRLYGYVTCLQVAASAGDKLFIGRPCCVQAMYNAWFDKIHPEQGEATNRIALIAGFATFGLTAPPFVSYRESISLEVGEPLKPILESHGINYSDSYPLEHPRWPNSMSTVNTYQHRWRNFHLSPLMKFCYHFILYCFILLLFSYYLLYAFSPPTDRIPSIDWTEILTIILISCLLIDEIYYFFSQDNITLLGKLRHYFSDFFKTMMSMAFLLFYIGLILRFRYADSEENFVVARIILAFDVELWWLHFLSFIIVIPFLGPHLVAIQKMLKDLLFFLCIIAIVMAGYGVASRSMVYYPIVNNFTTQTDTPIDPSFDGRSVFRQIAYPVYYLLYGEFGTQLDDLDNNADSGWSIATHVLLAAHMLFVNILLINLLIAMFSKRFEQVYDDTKNIWHSQQYLFTREYYTRSPSVPPISLLYNIYYLCRMFYYFIRREFGKSSDYKARVFQIIPKKGRLRKEWYDFEGASTHNYAYSEVKASRITSTKSSSESDSNNATNQEAPTDIHDDSNNNFDSITLVQDYVLKLNSTIEGMKENFNMYFNLNEPKSP